MNKTKLTEFLSFRRAGYSGDKSHRYGDFFGVELELENVDYDEVDSMRWNHWNMHGDGSLQEGGREFVFNGPKAGQQVIEAINEFYSNAPDATAGLRTSSHIHINASDMTVGELRAMMVISYTVEAALFRWIGENRKWCGYAMPLSEMPSDRLRKMLIGNNQRVVFQAISAQRNNDRYYGVNMASIGKHGTVEYRHFPGQPAREELENWLDFVRSMKTAGQTLPFPKLGESIETEQQLRDFLESVIPVNVWAHLRSVEITGEYWQSFNEIMALSEPDEGIERMDRLVFMKPQLIQYFVKNDFLSRPQADELTKRMAKLQVMTVRDFHAQMRDIRMIREEGEPEPETSTIFDELIPNESTSFDMEAYQALASRITQANRLSQAQNLHVAEAVRATRERLRTRDYVSNPFIVTHTPEPSPEPSSGYFSDDSDWNDSEENF